MSAPQQSPARSEAIENIIRAMNGVKMIAPQNSAEKEIERIKNILEHIHRASGAKFKGSLNQLADAIDKLATLSFKMGVEAATQKGKDHDERTTEAG